MTKSELISSISEESLLTKKDSEIFLNSFIKVVEDTVASGEKVILAGFGSFEKTEMKGKEGVINFGKKKGESYKTEDSYKAKFKAGKEFKEKINK